MTKEHRYSEPPRRGATTNMFATDDGCDDCEDQSDRTKQRPNGNERERQASVSTSTSNRRRNGNANMNRRANERSAKKQSGRSTGTRSQAKPSAAKEHIASYIPQYLRRYITPHHGDFCYSGMFHHRLIAQCMAEGFLPIATEKLLLPKLHQQRCVIPLPNALHVSKSVRKKSKRFAITINQEFGRVVEGCRQRHGGHCWLYPPLVEAYQTILEQGSIDAVVLDDSSPPATTEQQQQQPQPQSQPQSQSPSHSTLSSTSTSISALSGNINASVTSQQPQVQSPSKATTRKSRLLALWDSTTSSSSSSSSSSSRRQASASQRKQESAPRHRCQAVCPVRMYSIEVWDVTTGALAGGELGYSVGSIYTSLTGFSFQDSAGSVQLAALGRMLCRHGFTLWDLGMEMDYKTGLGSILMPRKDFVQHVHDVRCANSDRVLPNYSTPMSAKELIDLDLIQSTENGSQQHQADTSAQSQSQSLHHGQNPGQNIKGDQPMSKNQLKKLRKLQMKQQNKEKKQQERNGSATTTTCSNVAGSGPTVNKLENIMAQFGNGGADQHEDISVQTSTDLSSQVTQTASPSSSAPSGQRLSSSSKHKHDDCSRSSINHSEEFDVGVADRDSVHENKKMRNSETSLVSSIMTVRLSLQEDQFVE